MILLILKFGFFLYLILNRLSIFVRVHNKCMGYCMNVLVELGIFTFYSRMHNRNTFYLFSLRSTSSLWTLFYCSTSGNSEMYSFKCLSTINVFFSICRSQSFQAEILSRICWTCMFSNCFILLLVLSVLCSNLNKYFCARKFE